MKKFLTSLPPTVSPTHSIATRYKAFIKHFMYIGVDAIDASDQEKEERTYACADAATKYLYQNHGLRIKAVDIRTYYCQAKEQARLAGFTAWDATTVATSIANQVRNEVGYDAVTKYTPDVIGSWKTQERGGTVDVHARGGEVKDRVREAWMKVMSNDAPPKIREPDLRSWYKSPPSFSFDLVGRIAAEADEFLATPECSAGSSPPDQAA